MTLDPLANVAALNDDLARLCRDDPKLRRGQVWCLSCGRWVRVDAADSLRNGWPTCCGQTMTIDAPWERG